MRHGSSAPRTSGASGSSSRSPASGESATSGSWAATPRSTASRARPRSSSQRAGSMAPTSTWSSCPATGSRATAGWSGVSPRRCAPTTPTPASRPPPTAIGRVRAWHRLAIRRGADRVFLMGYAYRGPRSPVTGNIAPLVNTEGGLGLRASLDLYARAGGPLRPDHRGPARLRHDVGHPWAGAPRATRPAERLGAWHDHPVPGRGTARWRHGRDIRHRPGRGLGPHHLVPARSRHVVPDLLRHAGDPARQVPARARGAAGGRGHVDAGLRPGRPGLSGARG